MGKDNQAKTLKELVAEIIKTKPENIGEMDLFLYDPASAQRLIHVNKNPYS